VEIDEIYVGGKAIKRGRRSGTWGGSKDKLLLLVLLSMAEKYLILRKIS
jgi:hypothetical protein